MSVVPQPQKQAIAPLRLLFTHADVYDVVLAMVAIVGAIAAGVTQVVMLFFLRDLLESSADAEAAESIMPMSVADKMFVNMMYISLGLFCSFALFITAGNLSAARQKIQWRLAALKSILRQDVGWFDVLQPQELASKVTLSVEQVASTGQTTSARTDCHAACTCCQRACDQRAAH